MIFKFPGHPKCIFGKHIAFNSSEARHWDWKLATRDVERYRVYFPAVELIEPATVS